MAPVQRRRRGDTRHKLGRTAMRLFSELTRRVRGRLYREPAANLGDEVRFHLEMEAQALERAGLSPDAAQGGGASKVRRRGSLHRGAARRARRQRRRIARRRTRATRFVSRDASRRSRRSCCSRWASRSARTPRSSASSTPCFFARSHFHTAKISFCSTGRIRTSRCRGSACRTPTTSIGKSRRAASLTSPRMHRRR